VKQYDLLTLFVIGAVLAAGCAVYWWLGRGLVTP